jgi:hypothetical protein
MEHDKPSIRDDGALRAGSPNHPVPSQSSEPIKSSKSQKPSLVTKISRTFSPLRSPEPPRSTDSPEPKRARMGSGAERRVRSPDPGRSSMTPEPTSAAMIPEASSTTRNQNLSIPGDSPDPIRSVHTSSPVPNDYWIQKPATPEDRARSPNPAITLRSPVQTFAQINGQPTDLLPDRAPSRRSSLTKRTRDSLRKKPSFAVQQDEDSLSAVYLPIQSPSVEHTPSKRPASPVAAAIVRRTSARTAKAMSMSTYSASPTSPNGTGKTPPVREASPILTRNGKPVPSQSSYGVLTLQPMRPMSPLENPAMTRDAAKDEAPDAPGKNSVLPVSIMRTRNNSDNTEGNVNTNHPLLQTARHTRFAKVNKNDLPLRHYHSQGAFTYSNPDLRHDRSDDVRPAKRSSSLLYHPNTSLMTSPDPKLSRSATPTQGLAHSNSPNLIPQSPAAITDLARGNTASAESRLGIHPAHRTHDRASASTAVSSDSFSNGSSLTEHGATPPPIATTRESQQTRSEAASPITSPPARWAPLPPSQPKQQTQLDTAPVTEQDWQPHHQPQRSTESSSSPLVSSDPKFKTSATSNTPFYLNPASSSALIEFLATTPPQSPPHPGTKLNRDLTHSPELPSPTGAFFNRPFVVKGYQDGEASPPPPAPGSRGTNHSGRVNSGDIEREKVKKGWKKIFGVGKGAKKSNPVNGAKPVKGKKKKVETPKGGKATDATLKEVGPDTEGSNMRSDSGFVGVGPDGNWISRKNFAKT